MLVNGEAAGQPGLIKDTTTQGFRDDAACHRGFAALYPRLRP